VKSQNSLAAAGLLLMIISEVIKKALGVAGLTKEVIVSGGDATALILVIASLSGLVGGLIILVFLLSLVRRS